jgi:4-amino-4-deoxy-L-arabinose transferase-like glycosyltransferase
MKFYHWLQRHPIWLMLIVAFVLRIVPASVRFVIGSDDGLFLTLGLNLATGQGYTGDGVTTQIDFPPGYPFFAAGIYFLGGGLELPTKLNILLIGTLLPLPVYWLTYQLADQKTALVAGLLTALHPALVLAQGNFESVAELPYSLLLYTGWALLWWALKNPRLWVFGLAGLLIGMAHLVRWEGVILGLVAAAIIVVARRRASLLPLITFLFGLALFALPYGLFLYRNTGSVLSPKTMLTQLHAAAIDATANDPYAFERSFFEHYEAWLADPRHPPEIVIESRAAALERYVGNVLYQIRLWFTSVSIMTLLWFIPFFIGLATLGLKETLFLLPLFVPLAAIPASVVDPRYFLVPLPVMMIFTAQGWVWLGRHLPSIRLSGQARTVPLASPILAVFLTIFVLASLSGPFLYPRPTGYRTAGLALRSPLGPTTHILSRKRQIPFYAGAVWEWLPFSDLDGVLAYAASKNADYLVVDEFTTPLLRPQLAYLLDPANAPDNLKPVYVDGKEGIVIYRISH